MPRNGSGTYSAAASSFNPAINGVQAAAVDWNGLLTDLSTAMTQSIAKDGQTPITANLIMSGFKHTGVAAGSSRTDYTQVGQAQDGSINWVDGGGTADAITATYAIALTALVDGQLCYVRATAANATTTPTFSPNSLTAHTIVKNGGTALAAGDIAADGAQLILRYDLANTRWELLNPAVTITSIPDASTTVKGIVELATVAEALAGTDTTRAITSDGLKAAVGTIQQNSKSADYTFALTDVGQHVYHPAADTNNRTFTVPANASVAFPIGSAITIVNMINTISIPITSDTMYLMGAGSTGTRTLAAKGIATLLKTGTTEWVISGTGLT